MTVVQKMIEVMKRVGAITKDRKAPSVMGGYAFRGIDDLLNALQHPFAEVGIVVLPKVLEITREERTTAKGGVQIYTILLVEYTFTAGPGDSVVAVAVGEGQDTGDKSANKAMSSAFKNAMIQVFAIRTEETDRDAEACEVEKPKPQQAPRTTMRKPADFDAGESWKDLKELVLQIGRDDRMEDACKLILEADHQDNTLPPAEEIPPAVYTLQSLMIKRGVKFTPDGPQGMTAEIHNQILKILADIKL